MEDCILHKNIILVFKGEDKCIPFFRTIETSIERN